MVSQFPSSGRGLIRGAAIAVAVGSPVASHLALAMGRGYGLAVALAGLQATAIGVALWSARGPLRWTGPLVAAALLAALATGGLRSGPTGLLAAAGLSHALLYTGLLLVFGATLRPGRVALVTRFARLLNPAFHPGMVAYTRAVTWAWCAFFVAQLLASALLLAVAPDYWPAFVTTLHAPLVAVMAAAEFLIRRWRWRNEHYTSLMDTIRGVTAIARAARTSRPAADCPAHSGNATPRPLACPHTGPVPQD